MLTWVFNVIVLFTMLFIALCIQYGHPGAYIGTMNIVEGKHEFLFAWWCWPYWVIFGYGPHLSHECPGRQLVTTCDIRSGHLSPVAWCQRWPPMTCVRGDNFRGYHLWPIGTCVAKCYIFDHDALLDIRQQIYTTQELHSNFWPVYEYHIIVTGQFVICM